MKENNIHSRVKKFIKKKAENSIAIEDIYVYVGDEEIKKEKM